MFISNRFKGGTQRSTYRKTAREVTTLSRLYHEHVVRYYQVLLLLLLLLLPPPPPPSPSPQLLFTIGVD